MKISNFYLNRHALQNMVSHTDYSLQKCSGWEASLLYPSSRITIRLEQENYFLKAQIIYIQWRSKQICIMVST